MRLSDLEDYDFSLPAELLRSKGVEPRDSAKLFVYDTKKNRVFHDVFRNLGKYLPENTTLVFNKTKVLPARLWMQKSTGGKIEVFVLINEWQGSTEKIPVKVDRKVEIGEELFLEGKKIFTFVDQVEGIFWVKLVNEKQDLEELLFTHGSTPIPPYLKENNQKEQELRERYQAVFAEKGASVAAPTASLHFTKELIQNLTEKGIEMADLSLEVGLGTFAPLSEENFEKKNLHTEYVSVEEKLFKSLEENRQIIPVGTTALRAIESIAQKKIQEGCTFATDIFITPGYQFVYPSGLITNFHTPKSSLMLLVDAFLQHKKAKRNILSLYEEAMKEKYAFYSFGDSMLIL